MIPAAAGPVGAPSGGAESSARIQFSQVDVARFESALTRAESAEKPSASVASSQGMQALMKPFDHLDSQAAILAEKAARFVAAGSTMTPGEMVLMTMRSQEFMFHCQLTSNAANRTSDGLQQLFRQQS
jgi:hypothetical protein